MPFKPGFSGNPRGRPLGARKKITQLIPVTLDGQPAPDPLEFFASVMARPRAPLPLRLQAAGLLSPYVYARATARFVSKPVELPVTETVEQATAAIAKLSSLAAAGKIGLDEANDLVSHQKAFIEARVTSDTEARLDAIEKALERLVPPVEIAIEGGLPDLPGASILMPPRAVAPLPDGDDEPPAEPEGEPP